LADYVGFLLSCAIAGLRHARAAITIPWLYIHKATVQSKYVPAFGLLGLVRLRCAGTRGLAAPCLRGSRQRRRAIRLRIQIDDHIGALVGTGHTGKAHRRPGDERLGIGDESIELIYSPIAALGFHRCRIVEPGDGSTWPANGAPKIRADLVGLALAEGVACDADLGGIGAALGTG